MAAIEDLKKLSKEIMLLRHTADVLHWDQETYMPESAISERAEQLSMLQGMIHEKTTSQEMQKLLSDVGATEETPGGDSTLSEFDGHLVKETWRQVSKSMKLPKDLVIKLTQKASVAQAEWVKAREKSDFSLFAPHLQELLDLVIESADCIGYKEHPYDALLDEYEPYMKSSDVQKVFDNLSKELVPFVKAIADSEQVDDGFLKVDYPVDKQEAFGHYVLDELGYDAKRGRLDVSAHPFTITLGHDDVRITTRYIKDFLKTSIFGTVHECGHGLYEMGIAPELRGTFLADGTSLGIHESQSRFWENIVGRSLSFWKRFYPKLKELFPEQLSGVDLHKFYKAINKVEPSFIRVEADEVTYNLHIILRFNIEQKMVTRDVKVKELPELWNSEFERLFGLVPPNDSLGVLQDVHWAFGGIGYFPTYSLGNLYSAQFYQAIRKDVADFDGSVENGDFGLLRDWLGEKIHQYGKRKSAEELAIDITGEKLNPSYFMKYLKDKYSDIYAV